MANGISHCASPLPPGCWGNNCSPRIWLRSETCLPKEFLCHRVASGFNVQQRIFIHSRQLSPRLMGASMSPVRPHAEPSSETVQKHASMEYASFNSEHATAEPHLAQSKISSHSLPGRMWKAQIHLPPCGVLVGCVGNTRAAARNVFRFADSIKTPSSSKGEPTSGSACSSGCTEIYGITLFIRRSLERDGAKVGTHLQDGRIRVISKSETDFAATRFLISMRTKDCEVSENSPKMPIQYFGKIRDPNFGKKKRVEYLCNTGRA